MALTTQAHDSHIPEGAIKNKEAGVCVNCSEDRLLRRAEAQKTFCELPAIGGKIYYDNYLGSNSYKLTRNSEKDFTIEINPLIYAINNQKNESIWSFVERSSASQAKMMKKINECMEMYQPYLKGPDGESLKIVASNRDKQIDRSPIHILSPGMREHSEGYKDNIDCPTVLHEVLHLLGLADEYEETSLGYNIEPKTGRVIQVENGGELKAYDCRVLGPENSVMSNQHAAIKALFPSAKLEYIMCECKKSDSQDDCGKKVRQALGVDQCNPSQPMDPKKCIAKTLTGELCPSGFEERTRLIREAVDYEAYPDASKLLDRKLHSPWGFDGPPKLVTAGKSSPDITPSKSEGQGGEFFRTISVQKASVAIPAQKTSLLLPGHFRKMLKPYCSENKTYNRCTYIAYDSSVVGKCNQKVRDQCQKDLSWLEK